MKTLVVSYLPGEEQSNTKKLVDAFIAEVGEVEHLELSTELPDVYQHANLMEMYARDYGHQEGEFPALAKMDKMMQQVLEADVIVLAYPMYNFSVPAAVKGWIDSVAFKGKSWDFAPEGGYVGLLTGKALVLTTAGGVYEEGNAYDFNKPYINTIMSFFGLDTTVISAEGINQFPEEKDERIEAAITQIKDVVSEWY